MNPLEPIVGNPTMLAIVNPPLRKVVDLTGSKRENADKVAGELTDWMNAQGFKAERDGRVIMASGPPTEIKNKLSSWFGQGNEPSFNDDKVLQDYPETFQNPAWKLPHAETPTEQVMQGQVAVALSKLPPPMPARNPDEGNVKEVAVCCEAKECPTENPPKWKKSDIQSVVFDKARWSIAKAKAWLEKKGFKYGDVDEKTNVLRFRQVDPSKMGKFAMIPFGKVKGKLEGFSVKDVSTGIMATIAEPKAANPPEDEEGIELELPEDNPPMDVVNSVENRHYTPNEKARIMSTPEFLKWMRKWKAEGKAAPKQGYFHAFMSDVGHRAGAVGDEKWPGAVRYSDRKGVETPGKKHHYYAVGEKRRTIAGKPIIKPISNPEGGEEMEPDVKQEQTIENPPMEVVNPPPYTCPNDGKELTFIGWECPECGYTRDEKGNPRDKSWLMERRQKFLKATGADSTTMPPAHSREKVWVKGHERDVMPGQTVPVEGHYRKANPDDAEGSVGSLALDNPQPEKAAEVVLPKVPEHQHTFKYLGLCNPKQGGEAKKLLECVECHKRFRKCQA